MVDNRCSLLLNNQGKICINGKEFLIKEEIGRGASCICYTSTFGENGLSYIIKEFYPLTCAKRTIDMKVVAKDGATDEFLQCKRRFENLYNNNLTIQKTHKNLFVEPNYELSGNGYIVMPARDLCTLSKWVTENIPKDSANNTVSNVYINKALCILHSIAEQLEIYQKNNIIHFDIKPDNIFVFEENNSYFARIIDFDSMMTFSGIEEALNRNQPLKLYSTANCYGEETRASFYDKLKEHFSNSWQQIDVYPLGKLLSFMLTGNTSGDIDDWYEECHFLTSNKRLKNVNIRKYVLNRFIDKLTRGFGDRYSNAATVKFVIENLQLFVNNYEFFDNHLAYRKDLVPDLILDNEVWGAVKTISPLENLIQTKNIFGNKQSLLLKAECGMGKSTALQKLYIDAILFNQSKYRFVYYPLKKCDSEKQAKRLEKDVFAEINLVEQKNTIVFLDAFDESRDNDGGDCRKELVSKINTICETNSIILTSRCEVKNLQQTIKTITCKAKDFSNSELLKRIQKNSPWIKNTHGNILSNPLYAIMAESVSHIDDYAQEEKEIGKTCWNLIKEQLLGEIYNDESGKEQLKINYAGELIYNYFFLRILSQFTDIRDLKNAINSLNALSNANSDELDEHMKNLGSFGNELILSKNHWTIRSNNEFKPSLELFYDYMRNNNGPLYDSSWYRGIYTRLYPQAYAWDTIDWDLVDKTYAHFYFLNEIRGCLYNKSTKLSSYQEANKNCIQTLVDHIKTSLDSPNKETPFIAHRLINNLFLGNAILNDINFNGLDLSHIIAYRKIVNCSFKNCKLFALKGDFKDCSYVGLQPGSFIHPTIDKGYSYVENGNILTQNKEMLVSVSTFDKNTNFAKLKDNTISNLQHVILNAFNDISCEKIVIPANVKTVVALWNCKKHVKVNTLEIGGKTKIANFHRGKFFHSFVHYGTWETDCLEEIVDNIVVNESSTYEEYGGCLYVTNCSSNLNRDTHGNYYKQLLWINQCETITFYEAIKYPRHRSDSYEIKTENKWKNIRLPSLMCPSGPHEKPLERMYNLDQLIDEIVLSSTINCLDNLPYGYNTVNDFLVKDNKIIFDFKRHRKLLFLPDKILVNLFDFLSKELPINRDGFSFLFCLKPAPYEFLVISKKFFSQEYPQFFTEWFRQNANKLLAILVGNDDSKLKGKDVCGYLGSHILIIDDLNVCEKKDILRQQKEWDKFFNS